MRTVLLSALSAIGIFASDAYATQDKLDFKRVEVAFVVDTTGSMADLIDGAKKKIWSIANTIVDQSPDAEISMALVAYRDRGDEYVVKVAPLSEDIQGLYGKLVKLEADGGDDTPESVNEALDKTVRTLQWTKGDDVIRLVFLVGDAPPHMDYNERQYQDVLKEAHQRDITVNTVQAGDMIETEEIWKEIAQRGGGRYMAIPQSGGEIHVTVTPFDEDIMRTQELLDNTALPYGNRDRRVEFEGKMKTRKMAAPESQVENSGFYAKRRLKKELMTGGGDLIDDVRNKRVMLDDIKDAELPAPLQEKPAAVRPQWLADKTAEREKLEAQMEELARKRDAYVLEEQKAKPAAADSFDRVVEDALKTQLN